MILNKLSDSNFDNLLIEFIENINQVDNENYENIMKAFYLKIMSEINFVKMYLKFLKFIGYLYNKVMNYDLSHFISIVETKFYVDYKQQPINAEDKYNFLVDMDGETKRINNMMIIKNLVELNILSSTILNSCDNIIINQTTFLPDIYHWFNSRELTSSQTNKIKGILSTNITPRDKILLENLLNKKESTVIKTVNQSESIPLVKSKPDTEVKKPVVEKTNTMKLEIDNIIDEYILIKSVDDVKYFIDNRCLDAITKNKFCENLIDKYFLVTLEESNDILELIKQLIKSHTLFKSNLSRGLLCINNNWKDKSIDYVKPIRRMKSLLATMKNIGITKGLEQLIEFYLTPDN